MPAEREMDSVASARWGSLCDRFTAIKLGAYRHDLAQEWRSLVTSRPDTPGLLAEWELLEERIAELDDFGDAIVTRHWPATGSREVGHGRRDLDDEWDDENSEYGCPVGRCDRRVSAWGGSLPRCELFGRPMTHSDDDG